MNPLFFLTFIICTALGAQPSELANCPLGEEPENYIILGEDAKEGQFPYMLSLNFELNKGHACGASILTKDWALTAAHCCSTGYDMYLYSGSNSLSKGGKEHRIESMKIHEKYQVKGYFNDICLIKVKDPFVFGKNVQKVILPTQGYFVNDGEFLNVTGWGYTKPNVTSIPDKLQLGKNFVALSYKNCLTRTGHYHESYLCALGSKTGQGVCKGDSGSPIVKNGVVLGIASWAFMPCGCGRPEFYARVPIFIDWIKENLGKDASELQFIK